MDNKVIIFIVALMLIIAAGVYIFIINKPSTISLNSNSQLQSPSASQGKNVVILTPSGFIPQTLTIKAGETVTWINNSGGAAYIASNPHPIHTDYSPLNLGSFENGASLLLTFPTPGTHGYHNHLSPGETGTIIVQ